MGPRNRMPTAHKNPVMRNIIFKKLFENSAASSFFPLCRNSLKTGMKEEEIALPRAMSKNKSGILLANVAVHPHEFGQKRGENHEAGGFYGLFCAIHTFFSLI